MPSKKKPKPISENKPKSSRKKEIEDLRKRIKSIYSVNRKYRAQLVKRSRDAWICEIWTYSAEGRSRPLMRNVKPFATMEEAIQMAQQTFASFTGDDRYFAEDDIWSWKDE